VKRLKFGLLRDNLKKDINRKEAVKLKKFTAFSHFGVIDET
jgi:hypothetical protein